VQVDSCLVTIQRAGDWGHQTKAPLELFGVSAGARPNFTHVFGYYFEGRKICVSRAHVTLQIWLESQPPNPIEASHSVRRGGTGHRESSTDGKVLSEQHREAHASAETADASGPRSPSPKHLAGFSNRRIAESVGISRYTVAEYVRRADIVGITWPVFRRRLTV
jgi:hypothetical protein